MPKSKSHPQPHPFAPSKVPEGASGDWAVSKFRVSAADAKRFNLLLFLEPGGWRRMIEPGRYTRLRRGGSVVMSDTPAECRDHFPILAAAEGDVLLNGLGLGVALQAILTKPEVRSIRIIERSEDVIRLVAPSFTDPRIEIIAADAMTYCPPKGLRLNAVWHDIWDDISAENWESMHRLHRRYGRWTDWQWSWGRSEMEAYL